MARKTKQPQKNFNPTVKIRMSTKSRAEVKDKTGRKTGKIAVISNGYDHTSNVSSGKRKRFRPGKSDKSNRRISKRLKQKEPTISSGKRKRFRPGTLALMEIRRYQKSTTPLIAKAPFKRLVKELLIENNGESVSRISAAALEALQEATEHYVVDLFQDSVFASTHAKRTTVQTEDIKLVKRIRAHVK